jgi:hypothetical protein
MLHTKFQFIWLSVSEEKIFKMWKVNGQQMPKKRWQKLILPLEMWANEKSDTDDDMALKAIM